MRVGEVLPPSHLEQGPAPSSCGSSEAKPSTVRSARPEAGLKSELTGRMKQDEKIREIKGCVPRPDIIDVVGNLLLGLGLGVRGSTTGS